MTVANILASRIVSEIFNVEQWACPWNLG